ncbi:MAG: metal-dependent transcriptional regulator [Chloroflexi bacterium]|nr:metal-dependent transcriptional regulator [Chloroflexota bacterium]
MERKPSRTVEDYLQIMHYMTRDGAPIIGARLAERVRVAPPTVTATLHRMMRDGLITMDSHKVVHLTDEGREQAESIVRRHALAERLLTDILGLGWSESHEEAHLVEHVISSKVERRLMHVLGNPTTCPHGNPIPGTGTLTSPLAFSLSSARVGQRVVVERIVEEAEDDLDLMNYFQRSGIVPRAEITVREVAAAAGLMTLELDGGTIPLGMPAAAKVRVLAAEDAHSLPRESRPIFESEGASPATRLRELIGE